MRLPDFWSSGVALSALAAASLVALGISSGVLQAAEDTTAPSLLSFAIAPPAVDTSAGPATVTLTARLTDDLAGVAGAGYSSSPSQVRFTSPSGGQIVDAMFTDAQRVSGTALDGVYTSTATISPFMETGTWVVSYFLLVDQVGNLRSLSAADLTLAGFPTTLIVSGPQDTTAPSLVEFAFTPSTVDTSAGPATVTLTARLTDDLAGVAGAGYASSPSQVRFVSPSGGQSFDALFTDAQRISGTPLDGVYSFTATISPFVEAGTWVASSFLLVDQIGNPRTLLATDLAAAGFPTSLVIGGGPEDTTAPSLVTFGMAPAVVDTTLGAATLTLTARLTDDLAGVAGTGYSSSPTQVRLVSPSSGQFFDALFTDTQRVSGTSLDGVYVYTATISPFVEAGTWVVSSFLLVDQVGNDRTLSAADLAAAGLPTSVIIGGGPEDTTAPSLLSFDIAPPAVDTSAGPATFTLTAHLTDDLAGVAGAGYSSSPSQVRFVSPSGGQIVDAMFTDAQRVSGTALDGVYIYTATISPFMQAGTWTVSSFLLVDQVGNLRFLSAADLTAAGFPATLIVSGPEDTTAPALVEFAITPGTVDTSGGPATLTLTARLTDDLAGVAGAGYSSSPSQVRFISPSGGELLDALFTDAQRISGTPLDGVYTSTAAIPQSAQAGTWTVASFLLVDQVGNLRSLSAADVTAAGFPSTFTVGAGLPPTPVTGRLVATVRDDATGAAMPGVTVQLLSPLHSVLDSGTTAADGTHTFANVAPGPYKVRTAGTSDYVDELFADIYCEINCDLNSGTVMSVNAGVDTPVTLSLGHDVPAAQAFHIDPPVPWSPGTSVSQIVRAHGVPFGCSDARVLIERTTGERLTLGFVGNVPRVAWNFFFGWPLPAGEEPAKYIWEGRNECAGLSLEGQVPAGGYPKTIPMAGYGMVVSPRFVIDRSLVFEQDGVPSRVYGFHGVGFPGSCSASLFARLSDGTRQSIVSVTSDADGYWGEVGRVAPDEAHDAVTAYEWEGTGACTGTTLLGGNPGGDFPRLVLLSDIADPAPPTTIVTSTLEGANVRVRFESTDASSGVKALVVRWPGTIIVTPACDFCNGVIDHLIFFPADALVTLTVQAIDNAGNFEALQTVTVGTPPPPPTGGIAAIVKDQQTADPLAGVSVDILNGAGAVIGTGTTNSLGVALVESLSPGSYYVRTSNTAGYIDELYQDVPCEGGCALSAGTSLAVVAGSTSAAQVLLSQPAVIEGTVVDAAALSGLSNVQVLVYNQAGNQVATATTNATGQYSVGDLQGGQYYARTNNGQGYVDELFENISCAAGCSITAGKVISVGAGEASTADFSLFPPGGGLAGSVTDSATGAPLAGVTVTAYDTSGAVKAAAVTNVNGEYLTSDVATGSYHLKTTNDDGYVDELFDNIECAVGCAVTSGTVVTHAAGITGSYANFALSLGTRLSGTVTAQQGGAPIPNVRVEIYRSDGTPLTSVHTNAAGTYQSVALPEAYYFAKTGNSAGYADVLYDQIDCAAGCTITGGTAISATVMSPPGAIDFSLAANTSADHLTVTPETPGGATPVEITFSSISSPGNTTVTTSSTGPAIPAGFQLGDPATYYNLSTTAGFAPPVTVCVNYAGVSYTEGSELQLLHYENGAWTNVTTAPAAGGIICGVVSSFSPFAVVETRTIEVPEGRMKGTGSVAAPNLDVRFDFNVREREPKGERGRLSLEVKPTKKGKNADTFESRTVTAVAFSDDPNFIPGRKKKEPTADSVVFAGEGRWNKTGGFRYEVRATDRGEPGSRDTFDVTIRDAAGRVVAAYGGPLTSGNIQSVRLK